MKHHYAPSPPHGGLVDKAGKLLCPVLFCVFLIFCAVLAVVVFIKRRAAGSGGYSVCRSEPCTYYARLLSSSIDPSVDPCDDFYAHVCGGWDRRNAISVYRETVQTFLRSLASSLRSTYVPNGPQTTIQKAARFFQNCEDIVLKGRDEVRQFKDILRRADVEWPKPSSSPDVLFTMTMLFKILGLQSLIIMERIYRGDTQTFILSPGPLLTKQSQKRRGLSRARYFNALSGMLAPSDAGQKLFTYEELGPVETSVFQWLYIEHPVYQEVFRVRDIGSLTPNISWERWNDTFYRAYSMPARTKLVLVAPDSVYVRKFGLLLTAIGDPALHMYISWCAVEELSPFMSVNTATATYGSLKNAEDSIVVDCLRVTETVLGWMALARYSYEMYTPQVRLEIREVIKSVGNTMLHKLRRSTWIYENITDDIEYHKMLHASLGPIENVESPAELDSAFARYPNMGSSISDNWVKGFEAREVMRTSVLYKTGSDVVRWVQNAQDYDLPYTGRLVTEIVPYSAALPLYEMDIPSAVKYGALGTVLSKTFMRNAMQMLLRASKTYADRNSTFLAREIRARASCYERNGGELYVPATGFLSPVLIQASSTDVPWLAFARAKPSGERRLAAYPGLYENRTFFVAFCYLYCEGKTSTGKKHVCNEAARHSEAFADVFGCGRGSPMRASSKCDML